MEQVVSYIPQAITGLIMLFAGIGGTIRYYRNGRRSEPPITLRECALKHDGIQIQLAEGNRRMGCLETKLSIYNDNVMKLVGQHLKEGQI